MPREFSLSGWLVLSGLSLGEEWLNIFVHQPQLCLSVRREGPCSWVRALDSAVCLSPAPHCPLPGFVYSEALHKLPWFLSLLLSLSPFIFSPFLFPLLSFLFHLLTGSLFPESYLLLARDICKKDWESALSQDFPTASQYTGSPAGPRKMGLPGVRPPHSPAVAMDTEQTAALGFLLPLFTSSLAFSSSCSSRFSMVAHVKKWELLASQRECNTPGTGQQTSAKPRFEAEQGWVPCRHPEVPNQLFKLSASARRQIRGPCSLPASFILAFQSTFISPTSLGIPPPWSVGAAPAWFFQHHHAFRALRACVQGECGGVQVGRKGLMSFLLSAWGMAGFPTA